MDENKESPTPSNIYDAATTLLKHSPEKCWHLNLYRLAMNSAEFEIVRAAWNYFGLNENIDKEKLKRCQTALGFKNTLAFRKCLERNQLLSKTFFDKFYLS